MPVGVALGVGFGVVGGVPVGETVGLGIGVGVGDGDGDGVGDEVGTSPGVHCSDGASGASSLVSGERGSLPSLPRHVSSHFAFDAAHAS